MLVRLLRQYLAPYTSAVVVVLVLQLVQTLATLYLPSLNANIIDHGIAVGDTGYIVRTGGLMLAISLLQVVCAVVAVYFGARASLAFAAGCSRTSRSSPHKRSASSVRRR